METGASRGRGDLYRHHRLRRPQIENPGSRRPDIILHHRRHILGRLRKRWAALVFDDIVGPGIISGQRQADIPIEMLEAAYQIFNPPGDILFHVEGVGDPHPGMSCISPMAPMGETAAGLKPDSRRTTAHTKSSSTP